jgi:excisionase family DNA binding protein
MAEAETMKTAADWLSPADVARELHLSVGSVRGGVLRKRLPWARCGRHLRIRRADLEAALLGRAAA